MEDLTAEAYEFILDARAQEETARQTAEAERRAAHAEYIESQLQPVYGEIQQ